jgi:hypothetical protein
VWREIVKKLKRNFVTFPTYALRVREETKEGVAQG